MDQRSSDRHDAYPSPNATSVSVTSTAPTHQVRSVGSVLFTGEIATPESSQQDALPAASENWTLQLPTRKDPETKRFEAFAQDALGGYAPSFTSADGNPPRYLNPGNTTSSTWPFD